jgi:aldehyde:ferredoxin oxidoreductase
MITKEDVDGLDLSWGNVETAMELIEKAVAHEGVGNEIASGMKQAVTALHPDAGRLLVHAKGAGINLHDWRGNWLTLFGQFVAGTGPSWHASGSPDPAVAPQSGPHDPAGKAAGIRNMQQRKAWADGLGVCFFAMGSLPDITNLASNTLAAATGWSDYTADEAMLAGERITNLMRLIYMKRGFKKADEFDIGPKLLEALPDKPESALAPHFPHMVDEYYELMGWNVETGFPEPETIRRLDLEDFAPAMA